MGNTLGVNLDAADPARIGADVGRQALKVHVEKLLSDNERADRAVRNRGEVTYTPAEVGLIGQANQGGLLRDRPMFAVQEAQAGVRSITKFFGGPDDACWRQFTNVSFQVGRFNNEIASRGESRRWYQP